MSTTHDRGTTHARRTPRLTGFRTGTAALASALIFGLPGLAAAQQTAAERYQAERADCQQIASAESRQACLREAGAAMQAARNDQLRTPTAEEQRANTLRRCERLPVGQRADCVALHESAETRTHGSVEGGGVFRELRIIEQGEPVPVSEYNRSSTSPGNPVMR